VGTKYLKGFTVATIGPALLLGPQSNAISLVLAAIAGWESDRGFP